MELDGRVALVTGGGSGVGAGIARRLAREGARVAVVDIDPEAGRSAAEALDSAGRRAVFVLGDASTAEGIRTALAASEAELGPLDVLVNNAGGVTEPCYPDAPAERWGAVLDLNLRGPMLATQLAIQSMKRNRGGVVINVASMAGIGFGPHGAPEYAAAKAGLARFTAALAPLAGDVGVRVNCICPGWVDTPTSRETLASMSPETVRAEVPDPMLLPEQIADAVLELIRDDSLAGRVLLWPDREPRRLVDPEQQL